MAYGVWCMAYGVWRMGMVRMACVWAYELKYGGMALRMAYGVCEWRMALHMAIRHFEPGFLAL